MNGAVDAMFHLVIYFMKNAGEDLTTEVLLAGLKKIRSRGLKVFVNDETIELDEGMWVNLSGRYNSLEEAVMDALNRNESNHRSEPVRATK